MNPNKLEVVASSGRKITLADGREVTIRYGFGALAELEKAHGSVNALLQQLSKGEGAAVFSILGHALWAGSSRKLPLDGFLDLLDPRQIGEYATLFGEAIGEALGDPGEADAGEPPADPETI